MPIDHAPDHVQHYLFVGHLYKWHTFDRVDPRMEALDLRQFDEIWLGGDVCTETTRDSSTLAYLDSVFDFGSGRVRWAWGNHDVRNWHTDWLAATAGRPDFYHAVIDGLHLVVLNTNFHIHSCERRQAQVDMLLNTIDQLEKGEMLVIMAHHTIWGCVDDDYDNTAANLDFGQQNLLCRDSSTFLDLVYPRLQAARRDRRNAIFCISGDFGQRVKVQNFVSADSIHFLGTGLNNSVNREEAPGWVYNFRPDHVLIFHHFPLQNRLEYEFTKLDTLLRYGINMP